MQIAIPLFDGFTATDAIGPYEVLSRLPEAEVRFVASRPGSIASDTGFLRVEAEALTSAARPTVIVVPGGLNRSLPLEDKALMAWLQEADQHSTWTCSVCTGHWCSVRRVYCVDVAPPRIGWTTACCRNMACSRFQRVTSLMASTSQQPAFRPGMTWPWRSPRGSPGTTQPAPSNCIWSTTRLLHSTPAAPRRRDRRPWPGSGKWPRAGAEPPSMAGPFGETCHFIN